MDNNDIRNNPFHILHASPADDYQTLKEKANTVILLEGREDAENALSILLHPQNRLKAELSWFPGTGSDETDRLMAFLDHGGILPDFKTASTLSMINGCRCILEGWPAAYAEGLVGAGLCLAGALSELSVEKVMEELNLDREAGGFPAIINRELVDTHLSDFRNEIVADFSRRVHKAGLGEAAKAMGSLADAYGGRDPLYQRNYYLEQMIGAYLLWISDEEEKTRDHIRRSMEDPPSLLHNLITDLEEWDRITAPGRKIQKYKGIEDKNALLLFEEVKKYLAEIARKKKMPECTLLVRSMLSSFWDIPEDEKKLLREMEQVLQKMEKRRIKRSS